MSGNKDSWWGPIGLLLFLIAIGMDLLVWNFSGGVEIYSIVQNMIIGFTLAFGMTSLALLVVSLSAVHKHMRWQEQVLGLAVFTILGISLAYWSLEESTQSLRENGAILIAGLIAMLAAIGLVFGLLLALITGRTHEPDLLISLKSTDGDVEIELEA
ncbi:MAG: hypothetical protein CMB37_06635 [Euryarchaeota archaeon]|nr:hypothetical protein [Euryarchaeota archaeon]|tara:strand:- start:597 stop:1067 length:471 start_codon:yes stop_codon:yes gene_type:complete